MNTYTSLILKDGTKGIAGSAFEYCINLESVTIPDSVTNIGDRAFYECRSLKSVTIPDSVTSIGSLALGYIWDSAVREYVKIDGFTIYGYAGSEAENYAKNNGFTFVNLSDVPTPIPGDVDMDGRFNVIDALTILKYCADYCTLSPEQLVIADYNKDGNVNVLDVTAMQRKLANID